MPLLRDYEVKVPLSTEEARAIDELMLCGYGQDRAEVILYLMQRELDDLRRSGVIPIVINLEKS